MQSVIVGRVNSSTVDWRFSRHESCLEGCLQRQEVLAIRNNPLAFAFSEILLFNSTSLLQASSGFETSCSNMGDSRVSFSVNYIVSGKNGTRYIFWRGVILLLSVFTGQSSRFKQKNSLPHILCLI